MSLPLQEVNVIKKKASKPGNIWDEYIEVQDINNALGEAKIELKKDFKNIYVQDIIFKPFDKWLKRVKK